VGEADAARVAAPQRLDDLDGIVQLVERYGERAYRLALRIAGSREDVEEAVEHALLKASRIGSFKDESALASWIDRTVAHAAHQRRKRLQHIGEASLDAAAPSLAADGHFGPLDDWSRRLDEPTLQVGLRTSLAEAIDALPADYRTALLLHDVEGMPRPDIAEILDVDVPVMKAYVHRARLFVRKRLSDYFEAEGAGANEANQDGKAGSRDV
jgi:RNA polymerase sigma-70 factor (ECF subfamily)